MSCWEECVQNVPRVFYICAQHTAMNFLEQTTNTGCVFYITQNIQQCAPRNNDRKCLCVLYYEKKVPVILKGVKLLLQ
jgi:uncharacterized protein (DUF2237 family)